MKQAHRIYATAAVTDGTAYSEVQRAFKEQAEHSFLDAGIEAVLLASLRKGKV